MTDTIDRLRKLAITARVPSPTGTLSHVSRDGKARMVDVTHKQLTARRATARGQIRVNETAWRAITSNTLAKGDVLSVAKIAGIQAAKQTANLIPLCHPLPLSHVSVDFAVDQQPSRHGRYTIDIIATASIAAATGVEMEALTAVSVAALTIYDMCKAVDKGMLIDSIQLLDKTQEPIRAHNTSEPA